MECGRCPAVNSFESVDRPEIARVEVDAGRATPTYPQRADENPIPIDGHRLPEELAFTAV